MSRLIVLLFLSCFILAPLHAEKLGANVEVTAAPGWQSVSPLAPGQPRPPYPVLKFAPKDGRNAAILLSLIPADVPGYEVNDLASLKRFNLLAARPYLPDPDAPPEIAELKVPDGLGVAITSEDPALIGKAAPPGEYKVATTASVLLGRKTLIHCTIFHDEKDSAELTEALRIMLSATIPGKGGTI